MLATPSLRALTRSCASLPPLMLPKLRVVRVTATASGRELVTTSDKTSELVPDPSASLGGTAARNTPETTWNRP